MTPYQYAFNNPISLIDLNGDSINLSQFIAEIRQENDLTFQKLQQATAYRSFISEMEYLTGLDLDVNNNGMLVYRTKKTFFGLIKTKKPYVQTNKKGNIKRSLTARNTLMSAISRKDKTVSLLHTDQPVTGGVDKSTRTEILFNWNVIEVVQNNYLSPDLNKRTEGIAMIFFHELSHTVMSDPILNDPTDNYLTWLQISDADILTNQIRGEMGQDWGQKSNYHSIMGPDNFNYIPFSEESKQELLNGKIPKKQFLRY